MQSPSCGNKKVPLRGHQERQLQTLTSLGMASSRLWRAALVLTPLIHFTHLVRLTFQALGGLQEAQLPQAWRCRRAALATTSHFNPAIAMDRASHRSRGGHRKSAMSPAQCSPSWSSDQGRMARGMGLVGPASRRPKAAGVLVGHGGSAWATCSLPHLGSCEKALILTGTSAHQRWPLKLVKHKLAVPSCCSHSYSNWLIKEKREY